MILTSREMATVAWFIIFVASALTIKEIRASIKPILAIIFSPKLFVLFTIIICYNVVMVWWLFQIGYWHETMLYDTIVFVAIGGIGSISNAASKGVTYDRRFFFRTILVNLEVMVVFAFLSNLFSFNFWIEFLLIIPLTTILVMLVVVAEYQKGAEQVHRFLRGLQAFVGFLLIAYVVWQVTKSYRQLMDIQVLFSLGLPFVMSVLFVPVLFSVCALFAYEDAFLVLSLRGNSNKQLTRWKKQRLFLHFGFNLKALQDFRRSKVIHQYSWEKSKDASLKCLKSWPGVSDS